MFRQQSEGATTPRLRDYREVASSVMARHDAPVCRELESAILRESPNGACPLLQVQLGPADSFPFEVETDIDVVADLDEQNALIHPVVLAVEDHFPFNLG